MGTFYSQGLPTTASSILSRRRLLRSAFWGGLWLPLAGAAALAPRTTLAATEESPETEDNMEGPFYRAGAPVRSVLRENGMTGTPLTVAGRVFDTHGRPLKGALLDVWHADNTGEYDNKGFRLRGRIYTDEDGRYTLRTIKPLAYGEPNDKRPSHIHVKVSSGASHVLTTQLYFKGDPWNRRDQAVRPSLIMAPREEADGLAARFDFVLKLG